MQHEPKALVTKQKQQSLEGIETGDEETKWNEVTVFCALLCRHPGSWDHGGGGSTWLKFW